jgi:hypothetical protein
LDSNAARKTLSMGTALKKIDSMAGALPYRLIEFAVQTVILLGLLWGMIKIQKLDQRFEYKFPGLVGTAALATGLDQVLQTVLGHFIGTYFASYISTPIVGTVLLLCLKKITRAPYVDVIFTATISYALLFGVNLFILGSLMGELRSSVRTPDDFEIVAQQQDINKEGQPAGKANLPVPKPGPPANPVKTAPVIAPMTNPPASIKPASSVKPAEKAVTKTNPPASSMPANSVKPAAGSVPVTNLPVLGPSTNSAKSVEEAVAKTNPPAPSAPTNATPPVPAKPVEVLIKHFVVKGVTANAAKSSVTIQCGTKIYTIFLGETALTQTPDGPIPVRFKNLAEDWVDLEINGEPAKLPIH